MPGLVLQVGGQERQATGGPIDEIRVGFTVTKKVGNAVVRNRVRRRLRAAAEDVIPTYAVPGRDYVLIGRAGTRNRPFQALVGDLHRALKALRVVRADENLKEGSDGQPLS
jgi:ribonuclease P protein component